MRAADIIPGHDLEADLFHSWADEARSPRHWAVIGAASLAVHIIFGLLIGYVALLPSQPRILEPPQPDRPRTITKLVAPVIRQLTQKAPNKREVSREFNLASLPPRPETTRIPSPGAAPGTPQKQQNQFKAPPAPSPGKPVIQQPEVIAPETAQLKAQAPPPSLGVQVPIVPPPQAPPPEKPKLAFEKPGSTNGVPAGLNRIPTPKAGLEEAVRQAARAPGSRGVSVGDEEESIAPPMGGLRPSPSAPGKIGSSVELLSDPQGADFIPYLRAVLSAVRRNWTAIIPESARMGRGGRTLVQFAIESGGGLSKIVIASPSGARELDLAAVAGVTASNPFPPLPQGFKGNQIRLQFSFRYNSGGR